MLGAQHARVAAARPASASAAAARPATEAKPATKPAPAHAPAATPAQRAKDVSIHGLPDRPIKRRPTVYWRNYCFRNPYAAVCQGPEYVAQQTAPAPVARTVSVEPYAPTTQPLRPTPVSQVLLSAPAKPIVRVSDELAASVAVGASQADVLQKLGEPHSSISGGPERYTYFLQSGGSLHLDFEDGRVTEVRNTNN